MGKEGAKCGKGRDSSGGRQEGLGAEDREGSGEVSRGRVSSDRLRKWGGKQGVVLCAMRAKKGQGGRGKSIVSI